jgi:purine nucleosidase
MRVMGVLLGATFERNPNGISPDAADMVRPEKKFKISARGRGEGMPAIEKIIIDTDPGQDDAVAILLALASPELEVLGITAVAGNVPLPLTEKNVRKICELAGRPRTRVFAGQDRPLLRPLVTAENVHGKTGLDGPELPEPTMPLQEQHAVDFIIETVARETSGTVTLCALGPLTNIALAMIRAPETMRRIRRLVLMGGGFFEGGNVTPAAEFNIYVDPHAADVVFRSGVPIVVMPLDVSHKAMTTRKRVEAFRKLGTRVGIATAEMLDFYERFDEGKYGTDGGPLHDPCVVAYLLRPDLFEGRDVNVTIETASELTMGMTVVDWWRVTDRPPNAKVMRGIDADGYFALLVDRLGRLGKD